MISSNSIQLWVLIKHFVVRMFNNDVMTYERERREQVVIVLLLIAATGGYIARQLLLPYILSVFSGYTAATIWIETSTYLTVSMALTGIFSVVNWDNIFPDARDYGNLIPLPINTLTFYTAKFISLLFFIGILSAAFNVIGLFIFVLFLENLLTVNPFYFGFTHIVTGFLANLSVFLIVACLRSVFTLFSRNRLLRKLAGTIQPVLLMGFVSVLVWFQYIYPQMAELRAGGSSFMLWFPSMWFNGLYETMLGAGGELVTRQFYMALAALLLPLTIYLAGFPITFKRFITQTNSVRKKVTFAKLRGFYRKILHAVFLRNPLQRGVFYFMLHTLKRSRKHKLQMAIYMALPVSYILTQLVYRYMSEGVVCFNKQDGFLVSVSLIFYFFLAVAIWMTVRHPADIKANWIFKLTESADKHHYLSGLQKALIFFLGGPAVLVLFIFYSLCWGVLPALYHSLYSLVIFIMLLELFFMNHNKIPLAAVCDPGKPNIKRNWPLYIAGFLQYIVTFSFLGEVMLAEPSNYIPFFISIFSLIGALILRRRRNYKEIGYRFIYDEDEPEEVMLSLNLG